MSKNTSPLPQAVIEAATSDEAATREATIAEAAASLGAAYVASLEADDVASRSKLERLTVAAKAFPCAVTGTLWESDVRAIVETALFRRYPEERRADKPIKRTVAAQLSQLKPVLFALTNPKGVQPQQGETFTAYRERLTANGNGAASKGGNTSRGADRKGGKDAKGGKGGKNAAQAVDAALMLLTRDDAKFAADLSACLNDNGTRERLAAWCAKQADALNAD